MVVAQKHKKCRHVEVACFVYWLLYKKYGLDYAEKWCQHQPRAGTQSDKCKLLWNFGVLTDRIVEHQEPNLTLVNWEKRQRHSVGILILGDGIGIPVGKN